MVGAHSEEISTRTMSHFTGNPTYQACSITSGLPCHSERVLTDTPCKAKGSAEPGLTTELQTLLGENGRPHRYWLEWQRAWFQ